MTTSTATTRAGRRAKAVAAPGQSVTLTLRELHDLLIPVLPHVDKSSTLPVLGCVSFATNGEWLTATATDRYTLAVARTPVAAGTEFACLIQAAELKSMLAMFKPSRNGVGESVTLTVDGPLVRVVGVSTMFSEAQVAYHRYEGEYPKTARLLKDADEPGDPAQIGLNPRLLTKFASAQRQHEPLIVSRPHPSHPMFLRRENFIGAIMPARVVSGFEVGSATEWLKTLGYADDAPKAVSA